MRMPYLVWRHEGGQGLLEVILTMAIFGLLAAALGTMVVGGFRGVERGGEQTEAEAFAQEAIEAVRAIRDRAWNENKYAESAVAASGGQWVFIEVPNETIGQYTRTIIFTDVCRNQTTYDIASCGAPNLYTDPHTKLVTVEVTWHTQTGVPNSVKKIAYITNWDSRDWNEDTVADFSDGVFTAITSSTSLGDGDGALVPIELP